MTIEELKKLRESEDHVEFKEAKHNYPYAGGDHKDLSKRRRCVLGYVVALANECGGMLVLGMADKIPHSVVGTDFAEGNTGELVDGIYEKLQIRITPEELYENGKRVLVLHVPSRPVGRLLKFEGVALMRSGESLREMSDDQIFKILTEREPDFSAKICEGLCLEDLDKDVITILKQKYSDKQKNVSFLSLPDEQVLSDLELLQRGKLNYAALILLGTPQAIRKFLPNCNIVIEYRLNHSMISYTARIEFQEALFTAIDKIWSYINQPAANPALHVSEGPYIFDIASFNEEVVREAILNAITHRSYQIQSDIFVKQYPDSITITNAGGFPLGVNCDNLLTVNSNPRSRKLAEILQKTGLVERSGQGVDKMFYTCLMESKPLPDYSLTDPYQVSLTLKAEIQDKAFLFFLSDVQKKRSEKLNVFDLLTLDKIRRSDFSELDQKIVDKLIRENLIVRSENDEYVLCDKYKELSSIQTKGFTIKQLQIVSGCYTKNESVGRSVFVSAFNGVLTEKQVRNLIQKLEQKGALTRVGQGKATKYIKDKNVFDELMK